MKSKVPALLFLIFTAGAILLSLNTGASGWGMAERFILINIRVPRIIAALIVGAGLGISGAVFQSILRNPLAAPYVTGTSAGAALGAAASSLIGIGFMSPFVGFLTGLAVSAAVYSIASSSRKNAPEALLLAGVVMSALVSSLTFVIMVLSRDTVYRILFFLTGSLQFITGKELLFASAVTAAGLTVLLFKWRQMDIMTLGDDEALSLGVDAPKERKILFAVSALIVAAGVSVAGIIGFAGLAVPHIVRLAAGASHKRLIPLSALFGAGFLVFCDVLARGLFAPMEIPVGIVTAVFGAPFFLYLLIKR